MTNRATLCLFFHRLTFRKCLISQTNLSPASFGDVTERVISYTFFHCVNTTNIVLLAVTSPREDLKLSLMPIFLWSKDKEKKGKKKSQGWDRRFSTVLLRLTIDTYQKTATAYTYSTLWRESYALASALLCRIDPLLFFFLQQTF